MFKKTLFSAAILSILLAYSAQGELIHSTWVGGEWGQWETATNWDPPTVPDNNAVNTYAVTINGGTVELTANHSIDSLDTYDTYGKVNLKRWSLNPVMLTLANNFTNHGDSGITKRFLHKSI
jgi:hypothetical protein